MRKIFAEPHFTEFSKEDPSVQFHMRYRVSENMAIFLAVGDERADYGLAASGSDITEWLRQRKKARDSITATLGVDDEVKQSLDDLGTTMDDLTSTMDDLTTAVDDVVREFAKLERNELVRQSRGGI